MAEVVLPETLPSSAPEASAIEEGSSRGQRASVSKPAEGVAPDGKRASLSKPGGGAELEGKRASLSKPADKAAPADVANPTDGTAPAPAEALAKAPNGSADLTNVSGMTTSLPNTRGMSRDLSLSDFDIPIPSASDIGKKKGPTPPPTPPPEIVKEPAKLPLGVYSLFVTDTTCGIVGLNKEDAQHESLHLVPAKKVFQDILVRGKNSDFIKLKGQLQNYWEEMFTFRYITDDRYMNGHNFEIFATYDSREKLLSDIQTAIKVHEELFGPKHWENLGSDLEVEAEIVKDNRPPVRFA